MTGCELSPGQTTERQEFTKLNEEVYCVGFFLSTRGNKTGSGGTIMFHP